MLRVAEAQPVDQELVKMELSVISAVTLATLLKQLFVKTKIAQVRQNFHNGISIISKISIIYGNMRL